MLRAQGCAGAVLSSISCRVTQEMDPRKAAQQRAESVLIFPLSLTLPLLGGGEIYRVCRTREKSLFIGGTLRFSLHRGGRKVF